MLTRAGTSILALALAVCAAFSRPAAALGQAVQEFSPAEQSQDALITQFNQIVLGSEPHSGEATRDRLEGILLKRLAALDRIYHLSDAQKLKLKLAGRGDVSRLMDRINAGRKKFPAEMQRYQQKLQRKFGNHLFFSYADMPEIAALRAAVESGPFGDESLFAKTQKSVLTKEQVEEEERQRQLAARSTKRISLDNAGALRLANRFRLEASHIAWRPNSNEVGFSPFAKPLELRSDDDFRLLRTVAERHKLVGFDFSPKGDLAAIGENSRTAFLINLSTGQETALSTGNQQPSVAFSPDGKLLATGGYGRQAILWSVNSGKRIATIDAGPPTGGLTPAFSPDGKILAVGNRNAPARLFEVPTGELLRVLPSEISQELKFDPTGQRLAITHVNGGLSLWDVGSGKQLRLGRGTAEELYSLDWSADGTMIATSGRRAPVTLWRASDLKVVREIDCSDWVICVRFNPQGTRLVYSGGTSTPGGESVVEVLAVP
jgi:hypothetical protein